MPTRTGKDKKGCYARWGSRKKYYFKCSSKAAKEKAINKANKQGIAVKISK